MHSMDNKCNGCSSKQLRATKPNNQQLARPIIQVKRNRPIYMIFCQINILKFCAFLSFFPLQLHFFPSSTNIISTKKTHIYIIYTIRHCCPLDEKRDFNPILFLIQSVKSSKHNSLHLGQNAALYVYCNFHGQCYGPGRLRRWLLGR